MAYAQVVTHQLQIERRTSKVRRRKTDILPLLHTTNMAALSWGMQRHHDYKLHILWKCQKLTRLRFPHESDCHLLPFSTELTTEFYVVSDYRALGVTIWSRLAKFRTGFQLCKQWLVAFRIPNGKNCKKIHDNPSSTINEQFSNLNYRSELLEVLCYYRHLWSYDLIVG